MKFEILLLTILSIGFVSSDSWSDYSYQESYEFSSPGISYSLQKPCRMSEDHFFEPFSFSLHACGVCYSYITPEHFLPGRKLRHRMYWLCDERNNTTSYYLANVSDSASPIWDTFKTSKSKKLWTKCCEAADLCCNEMKTTPPMNGTDHCPRTWDGWNCWKDTLKGTTVSDECPWHVYIHSASPLCTRYASKTCLENATWYRNHLKEWSNYTTCGQRDNIHDLLGAHVITFSISIVFLIPALAIFFSYKQLQVVRIALHKNLFISLLANAVFVIIFESYFMRDSLNRGDKSHVQINAIGCKVFYAITKYLRMSTYMWMFCEGYYLHQLIAAAFAEQKSLARFLLVGWGFPIIPIGIWAALRQIYADSGCWTVPDSYFEWLIFGPMLLALLINCLFLSNIIRVLFTKLRSSHADEPTQFRRALKATVVLVPLFGIHFFLVMYHPDEGHCVALHIYNMLTYCIDGLQGALVAIIFCYLNHEVIFLLKRSYRRRKLIQTVGSQAAASNNKRVTRMGSRVSISTMTSMVTSYMEKKRLSK